MKQRRAHHVVPAIIMAGAAAVPIVTTAEILSHAMAGGNTAAFQPSAPVTVNPSRSSSSATGSSAPAASARGARTYQGPVVNQPFGGVQASVTISGKKITNVVISAPQDNPRSAGINQQAVPLLQSETLQAQSARINTISGATLTSQAYIQSLQAALGQAGSQGSAPAGNASPPSGSAQSPSVSVSGDD
jgi:uncharacterized protein with FMN-binding domain